jgi:hypothetical protein
MARTIYVEAKVTWFFEKSPTKYLFYADSDCDSFKFGRFDDSITTYEEVEVIGNETITFAKLKSEREQMFRHRMAVVEPKKIKYHEYIDAIERLKEEECRA